SMAKPAMGATSETGDRCHPSRATAPAKSYVDELVESVEGHVGRTALFEMARQQRAAHRAQHVRVPDCAAVGRTVADEHHLRSALPRAIADLAFAHRATTTMQVR